MRLLFGFILVLMVGCSKHPAGELAPYEPTQEEAHIMSWTHQGYDMEALATYDIEARVMSIEKYSGTLAPLDFALGWGRMSDPSIYQALDIRQSGRWYHYSWGAEGPPIPYKEIIRSSANTHLIPANEEVLEKLHDINEGQVVHLQGYLVSVKSKDKSFRWKSSTSRQDTGDGSCELFYVEKVKVVL